MKFIGTNENTTEHDIADSQMQIVSHSMALTCITARCTASQTEGVQFNLKCDASQTICMPIQLLVNIVPAAY